MIALFFDTETTGFRRKDFTPEIVQIGAILQDTDTKRVLAELNLIVTPDNPIPKVVSDIHGITDDIAKLYGVASELAHDVFAYLASMADIVVAHNISFDLGIIEGLWPAANEALQSKVQFCTMRECTDVIQLAPGNYHGRQYSRYKPPKLIEAYKHFFDTEFDNAHDAMADVRACRDVYFALIERLQTNA